MGLFKTLEFKDSPQLGKYAHHFELEPGVYEWGGGNIPLLMTLETTVSKLKKIYKGLDFDSVKLVTKRLTDIPTNSA